MKPSNMPMHLGNIYFPNLSSKYIWGKLFFSADLRKFILSFALLVLCIEGKKNVIGKHKTNKKKILSFKKM